MFTILVPVDGSPSSERAVKHVIRLAKNAGPAEVHLLYVDTPVATRGIDPVALPGLVGRLQRDEEEKTTKSAERLLQEAAVPHVCRFEMGEAAETIVRYARVHGCDEIVMGTRGMGAMRDLLIGSVATKVVSLVDIPVTLVK